MAQETPKLKAEARERSGTRYAQRVRRAGRIPAVLYGQREETNHVSIDHDELIQLLDEGAHLLELEHGGKAEPCLIRDLQYDHLGTTIIHVDFGRVNLTEEVTVSVPLILKGQDTSPGAKQAHAAVEQPMLDLDVRCLPTQIPETIVVDIGELELDGQITVGQLTLPEGVSTDHTPDDLVVIIRISRAGEAEEAELEAEAEAASAEPEVLSERREEGEGAGG
ncbi:MAG: 50S ribosomal protein L25 [Phycisphaerae bacterium]|nr:50S ribosomal protein L25 [Phycisphaerae bacterium]